MSAREWKPGDVGMSRYGRVFNTDRGWVFDDDSGYTTADEIRGFRPLVVIDPEDMKDVERLHALWCEAIVSKGTSARQIESMQAALREFADPKPRIDEPTGLGAVAETSGGDLYVRDKTTTTVAHWKRARGEDRSQRYRWTDLDVVRVLSEGVTS